MRVSRSRARRPGFGAAAILSARFSSRVGFGGRGSLAGLAFATGWAAGSGATTGGGAAAGRPVSVVRAAGDWAIEDCVAGLGCGAGAGGGVVGAGRTGAAFVGVRRGCGGRAGRAAGVAWVWVWVGWVWVGWVWVGWVWVDWVWVDWVWVDWVWVSLGRLSLGRRTGGLRLGRGPRGLLGGGAPSGPGRRRLGRLRAGRTGGLGGRLGGHRRQHPTVAVGPRRRTLRGQGQRHRVFSTGVARAISHSDCHSPCTRLGNGSTGGPSLGRVVTVDCCIRPGIIRFSARLRRL